MQVSACFLWQEDVQLVVLLFDSLINWFAFLASFATGRFVCEHFRECNDHILLTRVINDI